MSEKQNSYCIGILSSILNQEIIDVFPCVKLSVYTTPSKASPTSTSTIATNTAQTESQNQKEKKTPEILCISKSSLFFIDSNIKSIKRFFTFDNIDSITTSKTTNNLIFTLKTAIKKKKSKYEFTVTNYDIFLKLFKKQTTLYFIQITNEIKKIPITVQDNEEYIFNNKLPFTIDDTFEFKEKNASEYKYKLKQIEQINQNETTIKIKMLDTEPIEQLTLNPNIKNFYFCSWNSLCSDLMYETNQSSLLDIHIESEDTKETIEFKLRIHSSERNGKNLLYCYNRKKYLWPFLETFKDYIIIYEEKYTQEYEQIDFNKSNYKKYLQLKESFSFRNDELINEVIKELLLLKIESYLIEANNLNYLIQKLDEKQINLQSFTFLYDILYKINTIYNKYSNKKTSSEINEILKDIKDKYLSTREVNEERYEKTMNYKTFNDLLEEKYSEIKAQFINIKEISNIIHSWKHKINNYLEYIFTYPLKDKVKNATVFEYIIHLTQNNPKSKGEIYPIFRICVNMNAITVDYDIKENPEIYDIINNINNIQQLTYNNFFLCAFIRDGSLKDIFNIESDLMYFKFLNYLLSSYNTLNYDLISAIHDYIYTITKPYLPNTQINNTANIANYYKVITTQIQKYSNIFINNFVHIFTRNEPNTLMKVISLKCIIYLSYVDNISNLQNILSDEMYDSLLSGLSSFDSNLVYYSLLLISNISAIQSECLNLLSKYSLIITKTIHIIKGNVIPGCEYHSRIVIQALYVLRDLLKVNHIKDFLLENERRNFVKYLFNLINGNDCNYEIGYLVFEILSIVVDKKMDMKNYIHKMFNCFECINDKCVECLELIDNENNNNDNDNKQVYEFIGKLLEFVVNYVSIDLNIAKSLRNSCKNVYLLCIALRNKEEEMLNEYKLKDSVERVIKIFELPYNMLNEI